METFVAIFSQMLFLMICVLIGFALKKFNLIPENSDSTLSKIENNVCIPALILSITINIGEISVLIENAPIFLYSIIVVISSCLLGFLLGPIMTKNPRHIGLFRYSLAFTNFGFMGQSLIQGVFGDEMLFSYLLFQLPASIALYTFGTAWLAETKSKFSWKSLLNPIYICLVIGLIFGLTKFNLPSFITKTITGFASCYSPLAMLITGIVIAKYDVKELFRIKNIYVVTLIRMIAIPIVFLFICKLFQIPSDILVLILTYSAMPLGLYTIIIPAATGGDDKPGASMVLISNLIGLISVPLMFLLI